MVNAVRSIARVIEYTSTSHVRELVVIDWRQRADIMNEFMNAVTDDSISEQVVEAAKRADVDFLERKIKFSKRL